MAILLQAASCAAPITLRAAGGDPLSATEKAELLRQSLAGDPVELTVDIRPFSQEDGKPNRNHTRFRKGALTSLGRSGRGTVFLRDHAQNEQMARGGTVTASKMVKEGDVHELHQTVNVVKPWAVQGLLDGTIDRFSIGWHPTGPVLCTACNDSISNCWHWPGDSVAQDEGEPIIAEFEFQSAELVETSSVNVPAVTGTSVVDIRAALGLESKPRGERRMPSTPPAKVESVDTKKLEQAAAAAERERGKAIRRTGKALGLATEFIEQHQNDGTSADEFRKLAEDRFEAAHKPPVADAGRPEITAGEDRADKLGNSLQAAILFRAKNLSRVQEGLKLARTAGIYRGPIEFDAGWEHRGLSLREMARMQLNVHNVDTSGLSVKQLIGLAFTRSPGTTLGVVSGANSTSDFANLLENTLHKVLLAEYMLAADTWSRFCGQSTVSDFRDHPRYRRGSIGNLQKVNEHGEIKRAQVPDARRESISADEYGLTIAITRRAIINDDLDSFSRLPRDLGRAAARTIESAVYALLAENDGLGPDMGDGNPLFDAAHNNLGADAALSVASLDADRRVFRSQQDESGNDFLDVMPEILLVPLALGSTARTIIGAEFDVDAAVPNNRTPNKVNNMVRDVVDSPRLDANGTTNALTRRYLFADPSGSPTIEVVRLAGEPGPSLDARDGWEVSGREWRLVDDWGVGAVDFKTAVTNAGA